MSIKSNNLTRNFLLPLMGKPHSWYGDCLIGVYLGDDNQPELEAVGRIFLLISNVKAGENLILNLRSQKSYVIEYKVSDFETMVVLNLPARFLKDYDIFIKGKYSTLSHDAKKLILENSVADGTNAKILRRDPALREQWEERLGISLPEDAEVYQRPEPQTERFQLVREGENSL